MTDKYVLEGRDVRPAKSLEEWAFALGRTNRHVANSVVGGVRVSTVFLGLDHSFGSGPPLIFETMIFGGPHDEKQWRYSTYDEAEAGHLAALDLIRASLN